MTDTFTQYSNQQEQTMLSFIDDSALSLSKEQVGNPELFMDIQSTSSTIEETILNLGSLNSPDYFSAALDTPLVDIQIKATASRDLGVKLNFSNICKRLGFGKIISDETGEEFLSVDFRYPKTKLLVNARGKTTCYGISEFETGKEAIEKLTRYLQRLGYKVKPGNTSLLSLTAEAHLKRKLDLNTIAWALPNQKNVLYEPEVFEWLMITFESQVKVIVHPDGQIISRGGKDEKELKKALTTVLGLIQSNLSCVDLF